MQRRGHLFRDYAIEGNEPDAILMDVVSGNHRPIWYAKPEDMDRVTQPHPVKTKGKVFEVQGHKIQIMVEKYVHKTLRSEANKTLHMRVGSKEEVQAQLKNGFGNSAKWKYVVNVDKFQIDSD